jgi:hypothetical protein
MSCFARNRIWPEGISFVVLRYQDIPWSPPGDRVYSVLQSHMDAELYREFTILLATQFKDLELHGPGKDFVDRCIRLLKKVRFTGEEDAC